jgi:hypothetical protein
MLTKITPGFRIGDRRHLRRTGICWTFFCAVHPHAGLLVFLLGDQHVLGVTSWTATLSGSKDLSGSRRMRSELGHCVMAGREPLDSNDSLAQRPSIPHDHRHGTARDQMEMRCFVSAFPTQAGE